MKEFKQVINYQKSADNGAGIVHQQSKNKSMDWVTKQAEIEGSIQSLVDKGIPVETAEMMIVDPPHGGIEMKSTDY
jgi:hypothetical protein